MGEQFLELYRNKISKEYKCAFFATMIMGMLIHIYKFTNYLPNHDSLFNLYADQNIVGSGRWALSLACGISSFYDLPWVIGLISLVFISLTVVCIVAIFKIQNVILIIVIGGILASSPATTETFFFLFTADGYMLAMLLAAISVYCSKLGENSGLRLTISACCICLSCGIYQAYVSFSLVLALCHCIYEIFENRYKGKIFIKWIRNQVIIYVVALATYYIIWKLFLYFQNITPNDYQGIAEVGKLNFKMIFHGFVNSIVTPMVYFFQWNIFERGITPYIGLNIIFSVLFVVVIIIATRKSGLYSRKAFLALLFLSLFAIFPFSCIWHFTSETVGYRPMMLQSLTLLFILVLLLYERWCKMYLKKVVCIIMILIVFNNSLMANISYHYMNLCYERTNAEATILVSRIYEMTSNHDIDKIAIIGSRWHDVRLETVDSISGKMNTRGGIHVLSEGLEETLMFDQTHIMLMLKNIYGIDLEFVDKRKLDELQLLPEIKNMEIWPSSNCVQVLDDILIVRLSEDELD